MSSGADEYAEEERQKEREQRRIRKQLLIEEINDQLVRSEIGKVELIHRFVNEFDSIKYLVRLFSDMGKV